MKMKTDKILEKLNTANFYISETLRSIKMLIFYKKVQFSLNCVWSSVFAVKKTVQIQHFKKKITCKINGHAKTFQQKRLRVFSEVVAVQINNKKHITVCKESYLSKLNLRVIRLLASKRLLKLNNGRKRVNSKVYRDFICFRKRRLTFKKKKIGSNLPFRLNESFSVQAKGKIFLKDVLESKENKKEDFLLDIKQSCRKPIWMNMNYFADSVRSLLKIKKVFPDVKFYRKHDNIVFKTGNIKIRYNKSYKEELYLRLLSKKLEEERQPGGMDLTSEKNIQNVN